MEKMLAGCKIGIPVLTRKKLSVGADNIKKRINLFVISR